MGPKVAAPLAYISATGIGWFALRRPEAYAGDHLRLIEAGIVKPVSWGDEEEARVEALATHAGQFGLTAGSVRTRFTRDASEALRQAEYLARYIAGMLRGRVIPGRFLILWADGSEMWHEDVQRALDDVPDLDARRVGPVIVLPLESLGHDLRSRAGRSFYTIRLGAPFKVSPP